MEKQPLSLYLHYPFCVRKCRYCDFLSGPAGEDVRERYVQALCAQIRAAGAAHAEEVDTIFFGGGTPSLMEPSQTERIMEAVRAAFRMEEDAEISLELNPGTADREKIAAFRSAGINRLSIGVQSLRDGELRLLGRIHTAQEARRTCEDAVRAGFDNWSMDLMSALPGQTLQDWMETLAQAVSLDPPHLSAYSLIIEEGTPFASMKLPPLPDEETDRAMYHQTGDFLARHGLLRYEISNYAKPGMESRHNSGYWTGHRYLGLGLGASSCLDGERLRMTDDLQKYLQIAEDPGRALDDSIIAERLQRTSRDKMEEFMFLGLRMTAGVSAGTFRERFGVTIDSVYGEVLRKQLQTGLLIQEEDRYRLSERGLDVSNTLMSEYLF